MSRADDALRLLTVHAHPDDEASKGASTVARYRAEGVEATLVCCTGGEEGDILNKSIDAEVARERLAEIRHLELLRSAEIIGYNHVHLLGYRDSGMKDSPANDHPDSFHQAEIGQAIGRLVQIIRQRRPHVVVTYSDDQQGYQHPDHIRVNDVSVPAFELAADPDAYPGLGEPWQPLKMYYTVWSRVRIAALHAKYVELGLESPYGENWFTRPSNDDKITTRIDISGFYQVRVDALLAHATQVDPNERFWFGLPSHVASEAYPYDDYILARSLVGTGPTEDDLFAGVRRPVSAR